LRLMEGLRLRVKDVDFAHNQIVVRDGKGHQDRVTMLPNNVKTPLQQHLHDVHTLHVQDLQAGVGHVYLPYALERKYPNANRHGRASSGGITSTNWSYSGRYRLRSGRQGFPSRRAVIRFAKGLELTAYSVRSSFAPAFGSSSPPASGVLGTGNPYGRSPSPPRHAR
jgi:integrase